MRSFRKVKLNIIALKAIIYRVLRTLGNILLFGFLLHDWEKAYKLSILLIILSTLTYIIYDYLFAKYFRVVKDKGFVLWFTGLPCSGKTTIADALVPKLESIGIKLERLDGDVVRKGKLSDDLGFTKEDRDKNINRITFVSKLLSRNGVAVLASFVSPYQKTRDRIRKNTTNFIEVFVDASPEECAKRDVKGMWKLAKEGKIKGFTGYDDPYEKPTQAEIYIDSEKETLEESVEKVIKYLIQERYI